MKRIATALIASVILSPLAFEPAYAKPSARHCPPGLAKKKPACVPPGQAKKRLAVGDRLYDGHYVDRYDRRRYDLPRLRNGESYFRIGDSFVRVNNETREVLELIEAIGNVLD